ncbi:acyltransferase [Halobacillus sp. Marseille-Q1614]|uniref:acyltransferase n=1 Tax=Halobacillus sp. Marseille-Q1614 TaxID=2709134 RepID=UPI001570F453|nr:acyltransferase [Halobacillus sp. Marseille-Q1614]
MERRYFYEINFVRAVACLLVVMVHVGARFYHSTDGYTTFTNFLNQISRIGTPLFAVMSGFLLYNQMIRKNFTLKRFIKSRMVKIISPFIVWSFIYLTYKYLIGSYSLPDWSNPEQLKDFFYMFVAGKSHYHLYFISLVIQFYVFFILIKNWLNFKSILFMTIAAIFINYVFITNHFEAGGSYFENFINGRGFLLQWIYYFMLGPLLVHLWPYIHEYLAAKSNRVYVQLIGLAVIALTVFDYHTTQKVLNSNENVLNMFTIPIAFIVLISIYYSLLLFSEKIIKGFINLGNMSMGIFLLHPLVIYLYQDYAPYDVFAYPILIIPYHIMVIAICMVTLKVLSYLPFNEYIVTLVQSNNHNIRFNIDETKEKLNKAS